MKHHFSSLFNRPEHNYKPIDGVRALAILLVIVGHVFTIQSPWFDGAYNLPYWLRHDYGVDMFFVISGFLIGSILFKEYTKNGRIGFAQFYIRRFLRLMPVYILVLLMGLYFMENWFTQLPEGGLPMIGDATLLGETSNSGNIWTNILYINNFLPVDAQYLIWTWSLAIEEQFYIIIPGLLALILAFSKKRMPFFLLLLFISCVIRFIVVYQYNLFPENLWNVNVFDASGMNFMKVSFSVLYDDLYTRYGGLLIGVMGAYVNLYQKERVMAFMQQKFAVFLFLISLVLFFGIFVEIDYFYFKGKAAALGVAMNELTALTFWEKIVWGITVALNRNLFSTVTMFIILFCFYNTGRMGVLTNRFLSLPVFYPIAQLSYSSYLLHWMFMFWMFPSTLEPLSQWLPSEGWVFFVNGVLGCLMTFAGAILLYVFVERPCMEYRKSDQVARLITFFNVGSRKISNA